MRRWIRKWLGLDKLERRIELLERGVWGREKQLAKELAASRADQVF
jgi:hypothetical protein